MGHCKTILFVLLITASISTNIAFAEIQRFISVSPSIMRGSQPENQEDYQLLVSHGVHTILNLRTTEKDIDLEKKMADTLQMGFVSIPMSGFWAPDEDDMTRAIKTLTNPHLQPVFVHCLHGKDRTGLVIGLYRVLVEGWPRDKAYQEMKEIGFNPWLMGLYHYFWSHPPEHSAPLILRSE